VIYDLSLTLDRINWQEALTCPDQVLVAVEMSVVQNFKDDDQDEGYHAMYGIGADRGKLIIMNTWGELDLRAIDESWLRNQRCNQLTYIAIELYVARGPIPNQCLEEEERMRQALFYALAAPRRKSGGRAPDFSRQDDEDNSSCQDDEDKRARCAVQ